jgi:hypothetical protein
MGKLQNLRILASGNHGQHLSLPDGGKCFRSQNSLGALFRTFQVGELMIIILLFNILLC